MNHHLYGCTIESVEPYKSVRGSDRTKVVLVPDPDRPIVAGDKAFLKLYATLVRDSFTNPMLVTASLLAALGLPAFWYSDVGDLKVQSVPQAVEGRRVVAAVVAERLDEEDTPSHVWVRGFLPIGSFEEKENEPA